MRVLDATYMIDYLAGHEAAQSYYDEHGGADQRWITPVPAYAEVLVGIGNVPEGNVAETINALSWIDVYEVRSEHAERAARLAAEIEPGSAFLDGVDGLVAAVAAEVEAPVVSADGDLTQDAVANVLDVHTYRDRPRG